MCNRSSNSLAETVDPMVNQNTTHRIGPDIWDVALTVAHSHVHAVHRLVPSVPTFRVNGVSDRLASTLFFCTNIALGYALAAG